MLDNVAGLAIFAHVVECESFSRAAERLGLSKSAVSKQIVALENRLGTRLLNRTTRRLSLTEAGARLYERSQRIVQEVEAVELEAGQLQSHPTGRLRVSVGMSFGHLHLAPLLPAFSRSYPDLSIELLLNDRMVNLVDEGYDVALRIGELPDSSIVARKLSPVRRQMVASPDYLAARGTPSTPADLAAHDCLTYSYVDSGTGWQITGADGASRKISITPKLIANNGDALLRAAENGMGVIMLPSFMLKDAFEAGSLVEVLPKNRPTDTALYAVYPHSRNLSVKVRRGLPRVTFTARPWDDWAAAGRSE